VSTGVLSGGLESISVQILKHVSTGVLSGGLESISVQILIVRCMHW
jgi:hypothetical protein